MAETDAPRQPHDDEVAPVAEPSVPTVPVTAAATDETAAPGGTDWAVPVDAPGWPIPGELAHRFSVDDSEQLPESEPADVAPAAPRDGARSGVAVNARDVAWDEGEAPAADAASTEGRPEPNGLGDTEAWTGDDSEWTGVGATAAIGADAPVVGIEQRLGAECRSLIDDRPPALSWPDDGGTAAADSPTYDWDVKTSDVAGCDVWSDESQKTPGNLNRLWDEPDTLTADATPTGDAAADQVWGEEPVDATTYAWREDLAAVRALTDEVPHLLEDARTAVATAAEGAPTIVVMLGSGTAPAREQELVESIRRLEEQVAALTEQLAGLPAGGPRRSARTVARTPARSARSGSRAETKTRTSSTRSPTTGTATKATAKPATKRAATATATRGTPTKATAKPTTKRAAAAVTPGAKTPAKSAAAESARTSARTATKSPAEPASHGRGERSSTKTVVTSDAGSAARTRAKTTSAEDAKRTTASDGKRKAAKRVTAP